MRTTILRFTLALFTFFVGITIATLSSWYWQPEVTTPDAPEITLVAPLIAPGREPGDIPPPPPPRPPVKLVGPISGGVLNGKALSKPHPPYPPIAKAARASGAVTVQIVVDESGKVIWASAVSGHPLLRQAAEQAAGNARFTPTQLSGHPVKVAGVITYNFVLQ